MKKIIIAFLVLIFYSSYYKVLSQDNIYVSPGIKLGYQLGNEGGFVYGIEVSLVSRNMYSSIGGVLDLDFCKDKTMIHLGFQQSVLPIGFDIGPSLYFKVSKTYFGVTSNIFTGLVIIPFYSISFFPFERIKVQEFGSYLKFPIVKN